MENRSREDGQFTKTNAELFTRVADLPAMDLVSEEDVKVKVVLPMLKALGYEDSDFNYEGRTGRGYVDVAVERLPTSIVVETKAPRTALDRHIDQLEAYVFQRHGRDRATVAILTNGELFNIYGVSGALYPGSLNSYRVKSFVRSQLKDPALESELCSLLGKQSNQSGAILDAITELRNETRERLERLDQIDKDLRGLREQHQQLEARIRELEAERTLIVGPEPPPSDRRYRAIPHILRLLRERGARSESEGVERKWLDEQLVNKVEEVKTRNAVSFGLIELRKAGRVDMEHHGNRIRKVWLT